MQLSSFLPLNNQQLFAKKKIFIKPRTQKRDLLQLRFHSTYERILISIFPPHCYTAKLRLYIHKAVSYIFVYNFVCPTTPLPYEIFRFHCTRSIAFICLLFFFFSFSFWSAGCFLFFCFVVLLCMYVCGISSSK